MSRALAARSAMNLSCPRNTRVASTASIVAPSTITTIDSGENRIGHTDAA